MMIYGGTGGRGGASSSLISASTSPTTTTTTSTASASTTASMMGSTAALMMIPNISSSSSENYNPSTTTILSKQPIQQTSENSSLNESLPYGASIQQNNVTNKVLTSTSSSSTEDTKETSKEQQVSSIYNIGYQFITVLGVALENMWYFIVWIWSYLQCAVLGVSTQKNRERSKSGTQSRTTLSSSLSQVTTKHQQRDSLPHKQSTTNSSSPSTELSMSTSSSTSQSSPFEFLSLLSGRTSRSNSSACNPSLPKPYLILDLDETLIHASTTPPRPDHERLYNYVLEVLIDQVNCTFYVSERPHLKLFMEKVCEWYNVVIFTASVKSYANPVIDRLYHSDKIVDRLFRSSCYVTEHGVYIKDLKTVTDNLAKCMIVDNSPISYMWYQENAIPISNWMGENEHDRALLNLLPLLEALRHLEDVRNVLKFRVDL
ncbi:hypothetical protein C9374_000311 [Naegleria lovaniensis]|uniref:FCP1 homology domain-containing protein n=1 Tax=Naegleria lovaniensis TaxID=51637 RepID=A0AA88KTX5_NAELO|nr:uncharacterized protein C9374_000311 [Naegleria lovaniensis]KAG2388872.1 hypothetical protein C9374_000311 [Naegleria lovaniensis]